MRNMGCEHLFFLGQKGSVGATVFRSSRDQALAISPCRDCCSSRSKRSISPCCVSRCFAIFSKRQKTKWSCYRQNSKKSNVSRTSSQPTGVIATALENGGADSASFCFFTERLLEVCVKYGNKALRDKKTLKRGFFFSSLHI